MIFYSPKTKQIWNLFSKQFKNAEFYYQHYKTSVSDLELLLTTTSFMLERESAIISRYNHKIVQGVPNNVDYLFIVDSTLVGVKTDEKIELKDQKANISKPKDKLNNPKFMQNASEEVIRTELKKYNDFKNAQDNIILNKLFAANKQKVITLLINYKSIDDIVWNIQYNRELNTSKELYSSAWFDEIYCEEFSFDEIERL